MEKLLFVVKTRDDLQFRKQRLTFGLGRCHSKCEHLPVKDGVPRSNPQHSYKMMGMPETSEFESKVG